MINMMTRKTCTAEFLPAALIRFAQKNYAKWHAPLFALPAAMRIKGHATLFALPAAMRIKKLSLTAEFVRPSSEGFFIYSFYAAFMCFAPLFSRLRNR